MTWHYMHGVVLLYVKTQRNTSQCFRYQGCLSAARKVGVIKGVTVGCTIGGVWFCKFVMVGLANWYGTSLMINDGGASAGNIILVGATRCLLHCGARVSVVITIVIHRSCVQSAIPRSR